MSGTLLAIARRPRVRAAMEEVPLGEITAAAGLAGDHKGARFPNRQITVMALEDWQAALAELDLPDGPPPPWTLRRANLLVGGLRLPRAKAALIRIGPVTLEVTAQTYPCKRMDEALPRLMKALAREWRGGVTTRVVSGGTVAVGDMAEVLSSPSEHIARLP